MDTFTKLMKYELLGINEYWIVDPDRETVVIYNFEAKTNTDFSKNDELVSAVFKKLNINLNDIFN